MSELQLQPVPARLDDLLTQAAYAPLDGVAWLRVTGQDRVRWLNGMATNAIQTLKPGQGCYTFFLSAQGRIQGDAFVFVEPHSILLETAAAQLEPLTAMLDRYIIMDDVELAPLPHHSGLLLAGPDAEATLRALALPVPDAGIRLLGDAAARLDILRVASPRVPRFELWSDAASIAEASRQLDSIKVPRASAEMLEQLRILEGTPLFGTDIRERDLPQETAPAGTQSSALHFSKGCYLGQEIVERIHSRGNLHRTFSGFRLTGSLPLAGTPLFTEQNPDKPVGELTSVAALSSSGDMVALGYVRRETLERGETLLFTGGTAQPATLPFPLPAA